MHTRTGGVQSIHDIENGIDITTSFVKIPGGAHGGSWAARLKALSATTFEGQKNHLDAICHTGRLGSA